MTREVEKRTQYKFPIAEMEKGDDFKMPRKLAGMIHQYLNKFNSRNCGKFTYERRGSEVFVIKDV